MKPLITVTMALAVLASPFALATTPSTDHAHTHEDAPAPALQLNAGKKWETDAALRQGMAEIHQAMAAHRVAIHEGKLSPKAAKQLARKIEGAVARIVAQCKLPPAADAQLHIIVAELLAGAHQMAGNTTSIKPHAGAIKVMNALHNYATYFDDPGFQ
ncbi:MAG: hypothetical protein QM742_07815 [Aquabacterium sp.]